MKVALTADLVRKRKTPGDLWDARVNGLVLRVRASGVKSWAVVYGRGKKVTIGRADALEPDEARALAKGVLGDVAHGKDPQVERRKRKAGTLKKFVESQYGPWVKANRKTGDELVERLDLFGDLLNAPITAISPFAIEQWRTRRRRAGVKDTTINRDLDTLRSVLSKAVEWGVLREHPMRTVKRAKVDVLGRLRYLSPDEEQRLRDSLRARDHSRREGRDRFNAWRRERGYKPLPDFGTYPDHVEPIILTALATGLRRGELLALKWADVSLGADAGITVRGATAKSGLTRHVPLHDEVAAVLRAWRTCTPDQPDNFVFPGPQGEQMTTLKTAWAKMATAADLDDFTFHDLRHSFASKLVQRGVDLIVVSRLLGHADIKMTLRYSHLSPTQTTAAVAKLVGHGA
jgi:integrase